MTIENNDLFKLTPIEFEMLCIEILKVKGFERVGPVDGPTDQDIDFIGEFEGQKIAVQVKHTRELSFNRARKIIKQVKVSLYHPDLIIIMTSAPFSSDLSDMIQRLFDSPKAMLISQGEILQLLNKHPNIQRLLVAPALRRTMFEYWKFVVSGFGALITIVLFLYQLFLIEPTNKPLLQERIESVERAILNLKNLENQLSDIKADMVQTEKEARTIEQEYAQAKELEKLTIEQMNAFRKALRFKSRQNSVIEWGLAFLLGIAASLMASVIRSQFLQRQALRAKE